MKALVILLLLVSVPEVRAEEPVQTDLTVEPDTIRTGQGGNLIVALYTNQDTWLDLKRAYKKTIRPVTVDMEQVIRFSGVPAGTYGVQVLHDKDKDGKLGFTWLPPGPTEGSGISNNHVRMGKPLWEKATFAVESGPVKIDIIMRYP